VVRDFLGLSSLAKGLVRCLSTSKVASAAKYRAVGFSKRGRVLEFSCVRVASLRGHVRMDLGISLHVLIVCADACWGLHVCGRLLRGHLRMDLGSRCVNSQRNLVTYRGHNYPVWDVAWSALGK